MREVDTKDLAIALKRANEEARERFFGNVSRKVGETIMEEMQYSGPVRMSDVEEVQLRIVQTVRQLEEEGKIKIVRGDDTYIFIDARDERIDLLERRVHIRTRELEETHQKLQETQAQLIEN